MVAGDDFAGLLKELKERSGLSYGTLGKRLHMSASTLHRYVSGEVVPVEFAPVERMARLCRATPEELLELHRRWIRADAMRGVKEDSGAKGDNGAKGEAKSSEEKAESAKGEVKSVAEGAESAAGEAEPPKEQGGSTEGQAESAAVQAESVRTGSEPPAGASPRDEEEAVAVVGEAAGGGTPVRGRRPSRRTALYAGTAVALVAAVVLGATLLPDGETGRGGSADAAGATVSPSGSPSPSRAARSASPSGSASATPSASASGKDEPKASPSASRGGNAGGSTGRDTGGEEGVPVTVQTTPYYWDSPCEQSFLVDRSPQNMPPPPSAQRDTVGWATPLGAVSADRQMVALTVQGTSEETVVLQGLHLRVASSGAPLTWNKYAVGVGCGGEVSTKSFDVSLDLGSALVTPINGQRNFPYSVSKSDPEVFYVNAHTAGRDVRWYLELDWSSGSRRGTIRVDDHGKPFRTSASKTEYYGYMLGGSTWEYFEGT